MAVKLEHLIAQTILQGFDAQYGRFLEVTAGAQHRFEQAEWHAVQQAMKKRIHLYDHHVGLVVEQLKHITDQRCFDVDFLTRVKEIYTELLPDYPRFEIAESFFNSVYCRLFKHRDLTPDKLFVFSSQPEQRFREIPRPLAREFAPQGNLSGMLQLMLSDLPLRLPWKICRAILAISWRPCGKILLMSNSRVPAFKLLMNCFIAIKLPGWWGKCG